MRPIDLARQALTENPTLASMALARKLYAAHGAVWPSLDACYSSVRRARGAQGKKNRVCASHARPQEEADACQKWGALPIPSPTPWKVHSLPDRERWLIIADLHNPYHDLPALKACLSHAENNCDGIVILGDGVDAYQLSSWCRDPRKRRFSEELASWNQMLDVLQKIAPTIVWHAGNHEYRLERYLMRKAPELFDLPQFTWPAFCNLEERGIIWVPQGHPIEYKELTLLHGDEWQRGFTSPVNPARGAFLKAHECTLTAHCHRTSHHQEDTLKGRPISCWSIGCLCDLHPEYNPLCNKWNHGFAYLNTGNSWTVENHRIIKGRVV